MLFRAANIILDARIQAVILIMKVIVEGNIGAGKSTFIDFLSTYKQFTTFKEPIEKWQNVNGFNFLELMYENCTKYGLAFQIYTMMTNAEIDKQIEYLEEASDTVFVRERCLDTARYCFFETMMIDGVFDPPILEFFKKWYEFLQTVVLSKPSKDDVIVYIKTTPKIAYERIKKRNRGEENLVDISYVELLHRLYEDWIHSMEVKETTILTIDGDLNEEEIQQEYHMVLNMLLASQKSL